MIGNGVCHTRLQTTWCIPQDSILKARPREISIYLLVPEAYHPEAFNPGSMLPIIPNQSNLTS